MLAQFVVDATVGTLPQVSWIVDADGYYDVTVTADTGDGFIRRYAGRTAWDRASP
jgi:phospholipase C